MVGEDGNVWTHTSTPGAPLTAAKRRTFITRDGHLDLGNLSSEHGHPLAQTLEPHGIYHPTRASSLHTHTPINIHTSTDNLPTYTLPSLYLVNTRTHVVIHPHASICMHVCTYALLHRYTLWDCITLRQMCVIFNRRCENYVALQNLSPQISDDHKQLAGLLVRSVFATAAIASHLLCLTSNNI